MKSFHLRTSGFMYQLSCVPILESICFLVISWDQVLDARMHVFLSISSKSSVHSHPVNREAEAWPGVLSILGVSCIMSRRLWQNVRNLWKRKAKWILACRREVGRKPYLLLWERCCQCSLEECRPRDADHTPMECHISKNTWAAQIEHIFFFKKDAKWGI